MIKVPLCHAPAWSWERTVTTKQAGLSQNGYGLSVCLSVCLSVFAQFRRRGACPQARRGGNSHHHTLCTVSPCTPSEPRRALPACAREENPRRLPSHPRQARQLSTPRELSARPSARGRQGPTQSPTTSHQPPATKPNPTKTDHDQRAGTPRWPTLCSQGLHTEKLDCILQTPPSQEGPGENHFKIKALPCSPQKGHKRAHDGALL